GCGFNGGAGSGEDPEGEEDGSGESAKDGPTLPLESRAMSRFHDAVNEQIGREFGASQQYVAIAVHYDMETLPQLASHFYRQAVEERNHAMMLVQYLLDSGAAVAIPGVAAPKTDFADAVEP